MARPLRIDVKDGWYHITARGIERRSIFCGKRYYHHFLELLEKMSSRYNVEVHAYCLMQNHYHLIIRTPEANTSKAIQWLNVSYSAWFNAKRDRVGHVFQGRFASLLIDGDGAWLLIASEYLHLNPVRTKPMGLGKSDRKSEGRGYKAPSDQEVSNRIEKLRNYVWSSYRVYAGYAKKPEWLCTEQILTRSGGVNKYRHDVQAHLSAGADPAVFECLRGRVAIGAVAFVKRIKKLVGKITKEQPDRKYVKSIVDYERIVEIVENLKGQTWSEFNCKHGDWGRDLVLYLARKRSGATLRDIGKMAGGLDYKVVQKAVQRFNKKLQKDKALQKIANQCLDEMSYVET